jgi:hypothetical protein
MLVLFDFRQIVHSKVMPTRHLVKRVRALHHVNRQGNIRSTYIMMWRMLAVLMVSVSLSISCGIHSGYSSNLLVFKILNICNLFILNPAKFWVRCEAPIKEDVGITMISVGSIQRKSYPSTTVHECCIHYL